MNVATNTSASTGLRNICLSITAICISASMFHLYMAFSGMFESGAFLYGMIGTFAAVLIGSQCIFALTTQAIKGKMDKWVIAVGVLTICFTEGIVSMPTSQFAINLNMLKGTSNQIESSQEAREIRKAIERSEGRIAGLDNTLSGADATNMTNRAVVMESIETEERKIANYRRELKGLDETSSDIAFNQMMWGLSRDGFAKVISVAQSVVPACMSIMLGAMAYGRRESNVTPIKRSTAKGSTAARKKLKAAVSALSA